MASNQYAPNQRSPETQADNKDHEKVKKKMDGKNLPVNVGWFFSSSTVFFEW